MKLTKAISGCYVNVRDKNIRFSKDDNGCIKIWNSTSQPYNDFLSNYKHFHKKILRKKLQTRLLESVSHKKIIKPLKTLLMNL